MANIPFKRGMVYQKAAARLAELAEGRISLVQPSDQPDQQAGDSRLLSSKLKTSSDLSGLLHDVYVADDLSGLRKADIVDGPMKDGSHTVVV